MKKRFIAGFACGAVLFGTIGVFAGQYVAVENPFPVWLNGEEVKIEGYNINDNTYFKLRDVADAVGSFDVDFYENTILISTENRLVEYARTKVAMLANTETAELLSEDETYWYFAPCSYDMLGNMRDSGGHVSPATIVYSVNKNSGDAEIVQGASDSNVDTSISTAVPDNLEDILKGRWQHNSADMGSYYLLSFSENNIVTKNIGMTLLAGEYEIHDNTVEIIIYSDIARTKIKETLTLNYRDGKLYINGSNDYLDKITENH